MKFSLILLFQFVMLLLFLKVSGEKVVHPSSDEEFLINGEMELVDDENEGRNDEIARVVPLLPVQWREGERPSFGLRSRRNSHKSDERNLLFDEKYNLNSEESLEDLMDEKRRGIQLNKYRHYEEPRESREFKESNEYSEFESKY